MRATVANPCSTRVGMPRSCLRPGARGRLNHHAQQRPTPAAAAASARGGHGGAADDDHTKNTSPAGSGRQLLGVAVLASCTLLATLVKDRVTRPIVPPLIPPLHHQHAADDVEAQQQQAPASRQRGRSLLRTLAAPVRIVDGLLFPDMQLTTAAAAAGASSNAPATTATTATTHVASPSALLASDAAQPPAPDARAAAAGEALAALSTQLRALAAHAQAIGSTTAASLAASPASITATLRQMQEAAILQDSAAVDGTDEATTTAAAAVAPAAMMLAVTLSAALGGVALAAAWGGVAGLVDKRRASTPARRAAEAALLDSPLRPIACVSWPAVMHYLPSDFAVAYRWRDDDSVVNMPAPAASTATSTSSRGSSSRGNSDVATVAAPTSRAARALEGTQWSFAQIQAYRLLPDLLRRGRRATPAAAAGATNKENAAAAAPASVEYGTLAAATAAAGDGAGAASPASAAALAAALRERDVVAAICRALEAARAPAALLLTQAPPDSGASEELTMLPGSLCGLRLEAAWHRALQLVACDALLPPDVSWQLLGRFSAEAAEADVAAVAAVLPAAVASCPALLQRAGLTARHSSSWDTLLAALLRHQVAAAAAAGPAETASPKAPSASTAAPREAAAAASAPAVVEAAVVVDDDDDAAITFADEEEEERFWMHGSRPTNPLLASDNPLLASVQQLLGGEAGAAGRPPTSVQANRLVLLLCQAMLRRGDEAEAQLRGTVAHLSGRPGMAPQLPSMLAGCLEATLFTGNDCDRPGSPLASVMASLEATLPAHLYAALQRRLLARGLIAEVDVPLSFASAGGRTAAP